MSRHELACSSAGPGYCQVVSAQADWVGREPGGRLELRGQPEWINRFRVGSGAGRAERRRTAGRGGDRGRGRHTRHRPGADDRGDERDASTERLRALQAQRGGTLAQRLEVERQIAELQRHYDAQQIALRELNDRVQSARLTLDIARAG